MRAAIRRRGNGEDANIRQARQLPGQHWLTKTPCAIVKLIPVVEVSAGGGRLGTASCLDCGRPPARAQGAVAGNGLRCETSAMSDTSVQTRAGLWTAPGTLARPRADGRLECLACAHRCALGEKQTGRCGVRHREGDRLLVPAGYVAARHVRAIETNTVYHVLPGVPALTFGMYGCDLACPYCQNARISQALRDGGEVAPTPITAGALVDEAVAAGCGAVCAAYNEPMIAAEWVRSVFTAARARGLATVVVSDGNTTPEALAYLRPATDVYRVDLKAFTETQYARLGGRLSTVLEAIGTARALGYWVEVVTLVVPGFNDDLAGLRALARALAGIDPGMPWHLNAFQPRYRWRDRPPQSAPLLMAAAGSAYARGLRHVYVGNLTHAAPAFEQTRCPACHAVVITRQNYRVLDTRLVDGRCPDCGSAVGGLWARPARVAAA
jgi:pyruvate formate lyase activating enzyme